MWNKIKQFWNWLGIKLGLIKVIPPPEKQWPYHDETIVEDDQTKLVYKKNTLELESKLSRKLKEPLPHIPLWQRWRTTSRR